MLSDMMVDQEFRAILRVQGDRVYGYALHFLRNHQDAEDVTQEVFVRLWQQCGVQDERGRVAWLLRVTHNLCVDLIRRRQAHERRIAALNRETGSPAGAAGPPPDDAIVKLAASEGAAGLEVALQEMPASMRSLLLWHYHEGLTYPEIGRIVGAKGSTIKVRVFRARQMLRRLLDARMAQPRAAGERA